MILDVETITTTSYDGQKPGTSGLRKKVKVFQQKHYTENFVQSILNAIGNVKGIKLILGGDGRYYCEETAKLIIQICAANGVGKVLVGKNGILSTPAVSSLIRRQEAFGGIILTASHNPGGPENDFGIKYNCDNGGPAPDAFTNKIYEISKTIEEFKIVPNLSVQLDTIGEHIFVVDNQQFVVEVIDPVADYVNHMKELFDFDKLKSFIKGSVSDENARPLKILIDSMNGVTGPYVQEIFVKSLGCSQSSVINTTPLPNFGGLHPDPNLTYAKDLVQEVTNGEYDLGAAFDGDGDRNMILGHKGFFVTPSDSLAVIAHYLQCIPYFQKHSISGFARSMPTSAAIDLVGKRLNQKVFEVPTGWKYFGNLMDSGFLCLCGEESFGTGSNHIREKDGIWAILAWLSIMEHTKKSIEDILKNHWSIYGRNYFIRYDYEECELNGCNKMMSAMEALITSTQFVGKVFTVGEKTFTVKVADNFSYVDPVDHSVSLKQGLRVIFEDGSRIILRLSGTGSSGATVRLYIDSYERKNIFGILGDVLKPLINIALEISDLVKYTGRTEPSVIT